MKTVTPQEAAEYVAEVIRKQVEATKLLGQAWPDSAVYAVVYTLQTWPCSAKSYVKFFETKNEVAQFIEQHRDWAKLEDNVFSLCNVFEWDLGPQFVDPQVFNIEQLVVV